MTSWRIPLSDLTFGEEEETAALRVLRSRWLSMGPEVAALEQEFAGMTGARHAIAVANGTAALHLALRALGLGPGDEVIQPALNFVAACNMTLACGATPVFADILSLSEPTIDPAAVERSITRATKAVVVMHYGGYFCRMQEIASLCRNHGIALIEDACHAAGARYAGGAMAGTIGDIGCFSFFSNKNMATGEGGMVVTGRDDLAESIRRLRSHGMTSLTWDRHRGHAGSYDVVAPGYNYRLDDLRAAIGRAQLAKLKDNNRARARLVAEYRHHLADLSGWEVPFSHYSGESAYHLAVAVAPDRPIRDRSVMQLKAAGIQTSLHYPCIADFTVLSRLRRPEDLRNTREFTSRAITLPLFPSMTSEQAREVCSLICQAALHPAGAPA